MAPPGRVERRGLVEHADRQVDVAAGELVALARRGEVFEKQHEVVGGEVDGRQMAAGCAHVDDRGDVGVEPDLRLIGAKDTTGAATARIA